MLLRLAYLAVIHAFAALRLLPMSNRDKDAEIFALRHQLMVLERQLGKDERERPRWRAGMTGSPRPGSGSIPRSMSMLGTWSNAGGAGPGTRLI